MAHQNITGAYYKRQALVKQCQNYGIAARMAGRGPNGKRIKPTTIGMMRRQLQRQGVTPVA